MSRSIKFMIFITNTGMSGTHSILMLKSIIVETHQPPHKKEMILTAQCTKIIRNAIFIFRSNVLYIFEIWGT